MHVLVWTTIANNVFSGSIVRGQLFCGFIWLDIDLAKCSHNRDGLILEGFYLGRFNRGNQPGAHECGLMIEVVIIRRNLNRERLLYWTLQYIPLVN